jgi:translocon-associated protein subunit alpha
MKILNKPLSLILLLILGLCLSPVVVRSDDSDDSDEDAVINDDTPTNANEEVQTAAETEADEESTEDRVTSSPFVRANVLFIQPESTTELPAGRLVKLLVGFQNNGTANFIVDSIDGSFRYPQDFSYFIQNFSLFEYNKVVEANRESTFEYMFTPSETFSSRQFGLTINLRYHSVEGKAFVNSVFNDTINVVEPEEGLDGETFFLYIFLAALVVLVCLALQHFFSIFSKKQRRGTGKPSSSATVKQPNGNYTNGGSDDIDLDWIPKEHLQQNKSPKQSPHQRKVRSTNGGNVASSGNSSNDEQ